MDYFNATRNCCCSDVHYDLQFVILKNMNDLIIRKVYENVMKKRSLENLIKLFDSVKKMIPPQNFVWKALMTATRHRRGMQSCRKLCEVLNFQYPVKKNSVSVILKIKFKFQIFQKCNILECIWIKCDSFLSFSWYRTSRYCYWPTPLKLLQLLPAVLRQKSRK